MSLNMSSTCFVPVHQHVVDNVRLLLRRSADSFSPKLHPVPRLSARVVHTLTRSFPVSVLHFGEGHGTSAAESRTFAERESTTGIMR